jgi:hypothetical protein
LALAQTKSLTMLIRTDTGHLAGPFDVIGIMKDVSTGRFHACIWEEYPMPGSQPPDTFVRLKSKMHHTVGAETFEGAVEHVEGMRTKIVIDDANVWIAPQQVVDRDFAVEGFASVTVVPNWKSA